MALAAPIDRGFNRLAWLFPYSVARRGGRRARLRGVPHGQAAARRRPGADGVETSKISDPELADKLDDELRNLD